MSTHARRPTCDIKTNHLTPNEDADTSSEVGILSDMPVTKSVVERKQDIPDKGLEANLDVLLDQLSLDLTGTIIVMLGRMWDGNMIHCSAKADVAHNFLRLKEGSIYSVKKISVKPNKKEYQILKNDAYMLEFDGSTTIRKALVKADGFVRYSFQLQDFDGIESSDNKCCRLCDQFGRTNHLKTSSKNLDFHLANHRGQSIRVTLWGSLGDVLIEKKTKQTSVCPVILTATCPKKYNNKVYLSSTSSTIIYNNDAIPAIKALKKANSVVDQETSGTSIDLSQPRDGTLKNLPMWARNRKNDSITFHSKGPPLMESYKEGMNFLSCGSGEGHRKKEVDPYRLEVNVSDDIAQAVVIMLNETATAFVKCSADSLMDTVDESSKDHLSLPPALSNLIGTAHVMEIESHTYYEYGTFESFTCWQILPSEGIEESVGSSNLDDITLQPSVKRLKSIVRDPSIVTLSKPVEEIKNPRMDVEDSESEDSGDSDNGTGKKGAVETSAKKRKNRCGSGRVGAKATDAIHAAHEKGKGYNHIPFCLDD
ncbi:reverse transcriptase domain-containing protein [Tanacetum coccineum]|uniref:Reverse transcriptase domain-containing protein n=1 Tax=Tanacetum coccineum TaxID=301880 RepID=A0ABQ5FBC9_9ASTR